MSTTLIAYDLNAPARTTTTSSRTSTTSWPSPTDGGTTSTWLIISALTTAAIRDRLAKHLDPGDKFLVVNVTGDERS